MEETRRCLACFTELLHGIKYCPVCGSAEIRKPKDAYHLMPGVLLHDRYLIGLALGAGGFSIVYKAWDTNLKRVVAVKEFFPSGTVNRVPGRRELLLPTGDRKAMYYAELDRFMQEAKAMVKFKTHASIVHVLDYFEENDAAYIVMEYLEGIDLKDYLKNRGGGLSWEEASHIIFPIMGAVKDIHAAEMLHRDVAPDNIRITVDNKVKLMDFGAVRLSEKDTYVSPNPIIKNGYTPVEQYTESATGEILHTKQGPYTDIYALGATLYEMLTGIRPEESKDREQALNETRQDIIARPSELGIELPDYVERSIMLALAVDKNLRFKNISQMEEALKGNRAVLYPEQAAKRRRNRIILTTAAAAAMVFFMVIAGVQYVKNYLIPVDLNDFIKHEATLSVLLPVADDADIAMLQLSFDQLKTGFAKFVGEQYKFKKAIDLSFTPVPKSEYEAQLGAETPAIFAAPDYSSGTIERAADLAWLFDDPNGLNASSASLLNDQRKASFISNVFAPISFDIPIIYCNDKMLKANGAAIPTGNQSPAQLLEAMQGSVAVAPNCIAMVSESFGAALSDTEKALAVLDPLLSANMRFADFEAGNAIAYIGRFTQLQKVQNALPGYNAVGNIPGTKAVGIYGTVLCVSKQLSESDRYAAMLFLSYLYHPDAQRILFVQNVLPGIPVNSDVLELYKSYRRGAAALLGGAPNDLVFLGESNRVSLSAEKELAGLLESGAYTKEAALEVLKD